MVSIAASIISAIQLPDPSEAGLFNAPLKPRLMNYRALSGKYTCVFFYPDGMEFTDGRITSSFTIGDNSTALYHFGVIVDPLSESAQKWTSLFEVNGVVG